MMNFRNVPPTLANRSSLAAINRLGFDNPPLRRHLGELFARPYGHPGALLADPAFEAVFGWRASDRCLGDLAGNLLHESLVHALDSPPAELAATYRFSKSRLPYAHQLQAWEILSQDPPQSVVVSSGTGSGKTECFMVPLLDYLARLRDSAGGILIGTRALFLYPLNALINSQRERLQAWTHAFDGDIRFCLYNGNTPETVRANLQAANPAEVMSRTGLRQSPPPILVTNASMLEYMLVRGVDAPILTQSQGMLKWVVLDEAHSYVGSQAAEMSLLIRRVLHAFGVSPDKVRFVATSATIGDPGGEAGLKLRAFLADVAGTDIERVHLVSGTRQVYDLSLIKADRRHGLDALKAIEPDKTVSVPRFTALCEDMTARALRERLTPRVGKPSVATLSEVCEIVFGARRDFSIEEQHTGLEWLDLISGTQDNTGDGRSGDTFAPLRAHLFHQTVSGIWACADPRCSHRHETPLEDADWLFGKIYLEPRKHCTCGSPVYEAVFCDDCGQVHLLAADHGHSLLQYEPRSLLDEFELDVEGEAEDEDDEDDALRFKALVVNRPFQGSSLVGIDRLSRNIVTPGTEGAVNVHVVANGDNHPGCPACGAGQHGRRPLFNHFRLGAPFMVANLLPSMLEFAPDSEAAANHPYRGRRLLAFNDSRQGTARIASRLQQDAERNRVRGLVYHLALQHSSLLDEHALQEIDTQIKALEPLANSTPALNQVVRDLRQKRLELTQPSPIEYNALAESLSLQTSDFDRMIESYRRNVPEVFAQGAGGRELARMFLMREFGRRPKRLNNLESMGLVAVTYPRLSAIRSVPVFVKDHTDFSLVEWKNLLKIALDHFVRAGGSLAFPPAWRNWLGQRFNLRYLIAPDSESRSRSQRYWVNVERSQGRNLLVRLLAHVLGLDPEIPRHADIIGGVLLAAWTDLTGPSGLLQPAADGFSLPLANLAFLPMSEAWICPVTRRFLDTTLRGVTPYLPGNAAPGQALCRKVCLPLYDKAFGGLSDDIQRVGRARDWLACQDGLGELRDEGIWGDLNDRVIELPPYFRAAEHSAQQTSSRLKEYEDAFKAGDLNLLSCSTTMEMGIDIGGISLVAMNNVPPHPANYLQRAGRAGRRKEVRSLSLTLCKSNPHDLTVFANTRWAFDTALDAPRVSLDSPIIVQRHIQSLLLADFLQQVMAGMGQEQSRLTCGMFFLGEPSLSRRFADWCRAFPQPGQEATTSGIAMLQRNTCHAGRPVDLATAVSAQSIDAISRAWALEHVNLRQEFLLLTDGGKESPASRAVGHQLTRMQDEYLLRELATSGFLPAYGFPTHVASFDSLTRTQFLRERRQREAGRQDNLSRRRELASRDLQTALREYAPGADVVMDGLVYRSAGVTLNWHIPAAQTDVNEIQEFRWAFECTRCGETGSALNFGAAGTCPNCGAEISQGHRREFLVPNGFAVDFLAEPTNDINSQSFVPVEKPMVNVQGDWTPLFDGQGRYRTAPDGHIIFQSRGVNGTGYALCLACGRAEPMPAGEPPLELPAVFSNEHYKLRRNEAGNIPCDGSHSEWLIKREIMLGHETQTDVLELQLSNAAGGWLNDRTIAQTLAVALRDVIADSLGIQATELGCDFKPVLSPAGSPCLSILLFDRYAAGYASGLKPEHFAPLFARVQERLDCPARCDSACPQCVLDFDQRFNTDLLDRVRTLEFLSVFSFL